MKTDTVQTVTGDTVRVLGHWLYVRKCKVPDIYDKATKKLLLVMPEWVKNFAEKPYAWVELIAKGPKVGTLAQGDYAKTRKHRGYARHIPDEMQLGDLIMIPNQPWRMMHSPFAPHGIEFFIDETVPLCVYRPEE